MFYLLLTTQLFFIFSSNGSYLTDKEMWKWCKLPENVVEFNVGLFSTLLVAACVELVLCLIQMVNGLFGCICGTCSGKEVRPEQTKGLSTPETKLYELKVKMFVFVLKEHTQRQGEKPPPGLISLQELCVFGMHS